MKNTITVGALRQNPTQMLREVKSGATYVITDHGEAVAEVTPRRQPRWVPIEEVDALLRELGENEAWQREIDRERTANPLTDPWEEE